MRRPGGSQKRLATAMADASRCPIETVELLDRIANLEANAANLNQHIARYRDQRTKYRKEALRLARVIHRIRRAFVIISERLGGLGDDVLREHVIQIEDMIADLLAAETDWSPSTLRALLRRHTQG